MIYPVDPVVDHLNIPIELCTFALSKHKVNQVRLYVYLKSICSGYFKLSDERIKSICQKLGYKTPKTFKTNLKWLLNERWVLFNINSGNYYVLGYVNLSQLMDFQASTGAIFKPVDFSVFKPFIIAAVITYYMKYKKRVERSSGQKRRCPRKYYLSPAFLSLPHLYLAKILNIPKSTAVSYRKLAVKFGYISVKPHYKKLDIPLKEAVFYLKYNREDGKKIKVKDNKVYCRENDELTSKIFFLTKTDLKNNFKLRRKKIHR
jgi:hypothetical protein